MLFVDLLDPVSVEQRRCRRTISQRLLADAGFVLEPDLDRLAFRQAGAVSVQRRGEVFLKAATVSSSLAGWRGRALTCEKPSCLRILPIVRSW